METILLISAMINTVFFTVSTISVVDYLYYKSIKNSKK